MDRQTRQLLLRISLGSLAILLAGTAGQFSNNLGELNVKFSLRSEWWLLIVGVSGLSMLATVLLVLTWTDQRGRLLTFAEKVAYITRGSLIFSCFLLFGALILYPLAIFGPVGDIFIDVFPRLLIYTVLFYVAAFAMKGFLPRTGFPILLVTSAIVFASIHQLVILFLAVSTHPFSLGWSEASRYYYASLFFANKLYGFDISPSVLHPTRYMMQSLPFLFKSLPLVAHRLWQVLLWLFFTTLTAMVFTRRLNLKDRWYQWLVIAWTFLFMQVGPIYYHLLVPTIIVLWGFNLQKPRCNLILVLLASAWAGISRLNWYPVPAMLAAALYLMERPVGWQTTEFRTQDYGVYHSPSHQNSLLPVNRYLRYLVPIFLWGVLGVLVAFGTQTLYVLGSGNDPEQFTSSFTSDLLWYRLLPNATYPLGVFAGVALLSLPFWILMGIHIRSRRGFNHYVRWLGIGAMLVLLFAGGLLVSVKIGGGSNLHNMDAYLALLLMVSGYFFWSRFTPETGTTTRPVRLSPWVTGLLIFSPILLLVTSGGPRKIPNPTETEKILVEINELVSETVSQGGEVLFITQRQLPMFGYIPNVPMTPEYEVVFLMEMVMGGNRTYLDRFHADLERKRFDLIISDPMPELEQTIDQAFSEENNIWLAEVSTPLQSVYETVRLYRPVGIEIFVPK
jgi:hypothetical protein